MSAVQLAWGSLIGALLCGGFGNVLSKWAGTSGGRERTWLLAAAIGCFVLGLPLYAMALAEIPLGIAYPVVIGGNVILVTLVAITKFKEKMSRRQGVGLALILIGLLLLHGEELFAQAVGAPLGDVRVEESR